MCVRVCTLLICNRLDLVQFDFYKPTPGKKNSNVITQQINCVLFALNKTIFTF